MIIIAGWSSCYLYCLAKEFTVRAIEIYQFSPFDLWY